MLSRRFGKRGGEGLRNDRNLEFMQSYEPQLMGFVSLKKKLFSKIQFDGIYFYRTVVDGFLILPLLRNPK